MQLVHVKTPISISGVRHEVGAHVEVTSEEYLRLSALDAVETLEEHNAKVEADKKIAAIRDKAESEANKKAKAAADKAKAEGDKAREKAQAEAEAKQREKAKARESEA